MDLTAALSNELKNNTAQTCQGTSAWSDAILHELTAARGGKLPTDKHFQTKSAPGLDNTSDNCLAESPLRMAYL